MNDGRGARGRRPGNVRTASLAALMAGTAILSVLQAGDARAQSSAATAVTNVDIPAQPLSAALIAFSRQTRIEIFVDSATAAGKRSSAVSGALTPEAALRHLLSGTGLTYSFTNANTVRILGPAAINTDTSGAADGSIPLDVVTVTSGGSVNPVVAPYETPAPVAYISQQNIERFRGSSPADIFRGTPGVMSGEARNGAGSVDVNIRGMQGMGRVAVTVDGAENAVTVYQGYQGVSNRTFVDPDLLAGIDITKGSDAASNGIAGTVAMRTVDAADIVEDGKTYGVRIKGGFGTNTASPEAGSVAGYAWPASRLSPPVATPSQDGMDRPPFLEPTSGSGSVIAAYKEEKFDLLAAYAYRKQGNYFAGTHGPSANPVNVGPRQICNTYGYCQNWPEYLENGGIANYRAGEEVLNTQLETATFLGKGTLRFGDGQSLQFGYTRFESEAGDRIASRLTDERGQATQQAQTAGTKLDTGTVRYRWKPEDSDLIDLKANAWWSRLELRNPLRTGYAAPKPGDFRPGSDTDMWGAEITNISRFFPAYGPVDLTYGLSYRGEDTRPSPGTREAETWLDLRDGIRQEAAAFAKTSWQATEWLTVNGGLRYQHYWSEDRNDPYLDRHFDYDSSIDGGGFSPFAGITIEPFEGAQFYVNYSNALRSPSIVESVSAFTMEVNSALRPERSSNWEIGTNLRRESLFAEGDQGMVKLGYFNWDVKDYIAREWYQAPEGWWGMHIHNIDRALFSGIELSARYEIAGFTAELAANYYLNVEFCRTADTCGNKSLYADYATNQVPPEYSVSLTLSQKFLDEALTLGGRVSYTGPRAIGHGDVTAQGAGQFIALIDWDPYLLVDVFAEYKINEHFTASARIENLTDQFYIDPLSLVLQPGPGRTFYASLTATF